MKPLSEMEPDAVLREYYAERRRWESLILLTKGCDPAVLQIMYEASSSYLLGNWTCGYEGCQQLVQHEHREQLGTDGKAIMGAHGPLTIAVTTPVPSSAVAKRHGIDPRTYKRQAAAVLTQVAENLGKLKGTTQPTWQDAMGKLRMMARKVWS